ncbi:MAG: carboxypeptidase regulatory-like domain-containing protein, partial [Bryobacteraceae bacterium]
MTKRATQMNSFQTSVCSLLAIALLPPIMLFAAAEGSVSGQLTDPQGKPVSGARVTAESHGSGTREIRSDAEGRFYFPSLAPGQYKLVASAPGFADASQTIAVAGGAASTVHVQFVRMAPRTEAVTVTADVSQLDVLAPDPTEKVFASENLLDANPGRPGAPISIPGYPIETASSGIKAPQYFAPGVAGDHGEPIAQYIQVGTYLVANNLSANAHGNGYSDPNTYIANAIESVQVDGGAYNVREGNHALNLASIYGLRSHLDPFITLTGDDRDITGTTKTPSAQEDDARVVSGTVVNEKSEVVVGATVSAQSQHAQRTATTDNQGNFLLRMPVEAMTLTVSGPSIA